jgi:hypothetical protein
MDIYYSQLGRLLEERTPIDKDGYYLLCRGSIARYSRDIPSNIEVVTADSFINALVEGCKIAIQAFASSPKNKDVYAYNLFAYEQNSIYISMNTLDCFKKDLESSGYQDIEEINSLKYNQGNFDVQLWQKHTGEYGRVVESFENLADLVMSLKENESHREEAEPIIAFEAGIIKSGYQLLALKAVLRLISEHAFDSLNKTENFIAYTTTGNDYIDYSILMRKTINLDLFYEIFPDIQEKDILFDEEMRKNQHLSVGDFLDYWSDAVHSDLGLETFIKSDMEVFLQLEHFGNDLARECLERLKKLIHLETLERENYEQIYYYVEALHFSGKLTEEQKQDCSIIADRMNEKVGDLTETSQELMVFSNQ